jgi:hypothetical protein
LIIVPSPHNFSDTALQKLLDHVAAHETTLLFTGPAGLDEYWHPSSRLDAALGARTLGNVRREERFMLDGKSVPLSYGSRKIAMLAKETVRESSADTGSTLRTVKLGKGTLLWCGLPVEMNDRPEAVADLYRHAIREAGVAPELIWEQGGDLPGVYGRKLSFDNGELFIFVSEFAEYAAVRVTNPATGVTYSFALESERTVMFAVDRSGKLLAVYRPHETDILANS